MKKPQKYHYRAGCAGRARRGGSGADSDEPRRRSEESSSSSVSSETLDKLIDKDIADVQKVAIKNSESGEVLTLVPIKSSADSEANDAFTVEGWENEDVLTSNVMTLATAFYSITPTKELGAGGGSRGIWPQRQRCLRRPSPIRTAVRIRFSSAAKRARRTAGTFSTTIPVYIAPLSTYLTKSKYDFVNTAVLAIPDLTSEDDEGNETTLTPELESLHLSGTELSRGDPAQHVRRRAPAL